MVRNVQSLQLNKEQVPTIEGAHNICIASYYANTPHVSFLKPFIDFTSFGKFGYTSILFELEYTSSLFLLGGQLRLLIYNLQVPNGLLLSFILKGTFFFCHVQGCLPDEINRDFFGLENQQLDRRF